MRVKLQLVMCDDDGHDTLKVAERCEAELGDEQGSFITGGPRDWGTLSIPDGPITAGIDGGYVRDWEAQQHHFEVIVGKSMLAFKRDADDETPASKRFGADRAAQMVVVAWQSLQSPVQN
jgi:hypothetical protein